MSKYLSYNAENNVGLIGTSGTFVPVVLGGLSQATHGIPRAVAHPGAPTAYSKSL